MGLISAGGEHNRRGDEALAGVQGVQKVVEDIIIFSGDLPTHIDTVRQVLRRCADHGITLNKKKFIFPTPEATYCGFKVSETVSKPDDHLVSALSNFPVPTNRTDVRSLCGLAQQFEAFTPQLTELLTPIRTLLSPKVAFCWESVHQKAFEDLRKELSCPRILATFDGQSPLRYFLIQVILSVSSRKHTSYFLNNLVLSVKSRSQRRYSLSQVILIVDSRRERKFSLIQFILEVDSRTQGRFSKVQVIVSVDSRI